ncbi:carboxymuconolactone decarboxylase family protein [Yinghuangia sp. ASG 101]|uniref:carboxymuconolactone decarboxylase family protein n=1 Tax=Yinghuangia sp. ASG 101 TaxID=2896848 RepID=UPI001E4B244F|nr:carboxymuconolactone decarboxylase family protein [Yinghuangia sp. ASG 101]UGQ11842.1 carboxymuconolactone decarboxylase family protein [Yinghuangia sp. ASG 101]
MARVEPLPTRAWPREMRAAFEALVPPVPTHPPLVQEGRPQGLNALGTFAHHPELARAFFTFNGYVLRGTTLTPRQREILILRVSAVCGSDYQWAQHVLAAQDTGLGAEDVERVAAGPDPDHWDALDTALMRAADELLADGTISDPTWAALAAELDTRQIMDVIFSVSAFQAVARLFRAFGVELDDDLKRAVGR